MESVCSNEDPEHNSKNFSKHMLPLIISPRALWRCNLVDNSRHYTLLLSVAAALNTGFVSIVFKIATKNRGSPTVNIRSQYETFTACCKLINLSVKRGSRLRVIHLTNCACCLFIESCKLKINIYFIFLFILFYCK